MSDKITLFHWHGACSSVTRRALGRAGLPHDLVLVDIPAGEQKSPSFLAVNPRGKVPAVRIGDRLFTENPAILPMLDALAPQAGLLPDMADPQRRALVLAELSWCASTLHPAVRLVRAPVRFTTGDTAPVHEKGMQVLAELAEQVEERLGRSGHWLGERWSILDTYVAWCFAAAEIGGFGLNAYPRLVRLIATERPLD